MSQTKDILNHLKSGKKITPLEALTRYGCGRLASRIYDIENELGIEVERKTVTVGKNKRVTQYFL